MAKSCKSPKKKHIRIEETQVEQHRLLQNDEEE